MKPAKPNVFVVADPRRLELLDAIAIEIEGDRSDALDHVLDAMGAARRMTPLITAPTADRGVIDEWEPA